MSMNICGILGVVTKWIVARKILDGTSHAVSIVLGIVVLTAISTIRHAKNQNNLTKQS